MKIGAKIHRVMSCTSTNDLAKDLALSGAEEGTVVVADEQTQGRGTRGRSWYSAQKKGLYLSCLVYPPQPRISLLPIIAGLSASDAIFESVGIRVRLRWPNDLVWGKKKLGGILCESGFLGNRASYAILGIGINVSHERNDFPEDIRSQATSLRLITNKEINGKKFLERLCDALDYRYNQFLRNERERIVRAFEDYSILHLGKEVKVLTEKGEISGRYNGIDPQGGLILESRGERHSLFAGEIKR